MATLYSGVHLRLRSKSTPWEEKLKLARFAWVSPRCFMPNKEQALLDWVTHTLSAVYSNKLKMKFHTVESLWAFLNDVLRSRKLQNLLKQKQTISLRVFFPQLMLARLSACAKGKLETGTDVATLLSCCSSVLSSSPLATIFSTKFELLMQLLQSLLQIACASVHSPPTATTVAVVFPVLLRTLTLYEMTQRQQSNSWRVFRELTGQLLEPLLELRQWLLRAPSVHSEAHKVRTKVEAAIQAGLFDRSLLPTYRDELLSQVQDKSLTAKTRNVTAKAQQPSLFQVVLEKVKGCAASEIDGELQWEAIGSSAHLIFSCFLEAFGTDENHLLCFCALRQLLPVIRFDCACVERSAMPVDLTANRQVLIALDRLLSSALAADIYNIAVDHLEHGSIQFSCYRRLTDTLLRDPQLEQRAWYSSLHTLLLLNHQLLDADLRSVAAKVWAVELPLENQARKARDELLAELTRVYSKLRQLPSLFSALVSVMHDGMVPTPRAVLAITHARALANCLVELPPSQSLDIWEAVLVAGRNVLCSVKDEVQAEADMQMLRALGLLLHDVLSQAYVLGGGDAPSMTEARVHSLMADTLDGVLLPLVDQLTVTNVKPNDSGLEAVLLFALVWTMISTFRDIQAFNNAHGHAFSAVSPVGSGGPATDFSSLLPRLEVKDWIRLCKPLKKCLGTPLALHLLTRLMLQKIRSLLLRQSNTDITAPMAAHGLVSSAKLFVKLCIGNGAVDGLIGAWDGVLCSVDGESYVTAQFYLLVSHLPMVTSILRPDSTRALASFLFDRFLVNVKPSAVKDVFTLHSLSQDLLLSGLLPELRYLQASLVTVLIERLVQLCRPIADGAFPIASFELLCRDDIPWEKEAGLMEVKPRNTSVMEEVEEGEEEGPCFQKVPPGISSLHSWKVIRESANLILESAISCMPCSLPRDSAKELLSFLGVLSSLDLDAMLPGNKVRVFLVLFALVTKIGLMEEVTESDENLDSKLFVEEEEKISVNEEMVEEHEESKKEDQTGNATNGLIKDFVHVEQTKRLHDDCVSSNEPSKGGHHNITATEKDICGCDAVDNSLAVLRRCSILLATLQSDSVAAIFRIVYPSKLLTAMLGKVVAAGSSRSPAQLAKASRELRHSTRRLFVPMLESMLGRRTSVLVNVQCFVRNLAALIRSDAESGHKSEVSGGTIILVEILSALCHVLLPWLNTTGVNFRLVESLWIEAQRATMMLRNLLCELMMKLNPKIFLELSIGAVTELLQMESMCVSLGRPRLCAAEKGSEDGGSEMVYDDLYEQVCKLVFHHPESYSDYNHQLKALLNFLKLFLGIKTLKQGSCEEFFVPLVSTLRNLISGPLVGGKAFENVTPELVGLLEGMTSVCSKTCFNLFLKETLIGLSWFSFLTEKRQDLLVSIRLFKLLAQSQLDTVKAIAFLHTVPDAIFALTIVMQHVSSMPSGQQTMVLAVLETLAVLLRAIVGSLRNPHHVAQALQALHSVPLQKLATREDHDVFHAYHEILHCILQLHPRVMLQASASFLSTFRYLLHSIMREGRQKADTNASKAFQEQDESDKDWVLRCAQSMERLYCQVAACAANFTALGSFLVAEFVDELQKVTLRADVKRHLTDGIYAVLDVCREADLNMLRTCLSPGVQEIFRHLYADFQHFHQYKTRVRADTEDVSRPN